MKRQFSALFEGSFDVAIVGGGITGSCIARDAARRGFKVALIEKSDFSCGTSAGSTKLVHGGLRYLKSFELSLIRESLKERRVWERVAPHMVYPMPFMLPFPKTSDKWVVGTGLSLYDWLSFDRNWLSDRDQHMPAHRTIGAEEARVQEPVLADMNMAGAMVYYDCQMYSPERLGLACLVDASNHGAIVVNYAEAKGFERGGAGVSGVQVRDVLTGETRTLKARLFVNAAGPWADRLLEMIEGGETSHKLIRSKGIHIVTQGLTKRHALAVSHKGGHFFIVPWREHSIIGTTDTVFEGKPDELHVSVADVDSFIAYVNAGLPGLGLSPSDVCYAYAGLRPLVDDGSKNSYNASRKAEIVDHGAEQGPSNLISAIGGKWTTSREIAEKCVDKIAQKLSAGTKPCDTGEAVLPGATGRFAEFVEKLQGEHPHLSHSIVANLARNYGTDARNVIACGGGQVQLMHPLTNRLSDIGAEILYAVRHEMAVTLEDAVFRRTGLGTLGRLDDGALQKIAQIMGDELGWSAEEREAQIRSLDWRYQSWMRVS